MNARVALRLSARRRKAAVGEACPQLLRVRSHAERVLCDTDLYAKPLIPRKHQDAVAMVAYGALMTFLLIGSWVAFVGLESITKPAPHHNTPAAPAGDSQ